MTTQEIAELFVALEKEFFANDPTLGEFIPGRVVGPKSSKQGLIALHPTGFWITVLYWSGDTYSLRVHSKDEVTAIEFLPWNYNEVVETVKGMLENKDEEKIDD